MIEIIDKLEQIAINRYGEEWVDRESFQRSRDYLNEYVGCLHDIAKDGEPMGVSCPCPKCSPKC